MIVCSIACPWCVCASKPKTLWRKGRRARRRDILQRTFLESDKFTTLCNIQTVVWRRASCRSVQWVDWQRLGASCGTLPAERRSAPEFHPTLSAASLFPSLASSLCPPVYHPQRNTSTFYTLYSRAVASGSGVCMCVCMCVCVCLCLFVCVPG